MRIFKKLTPEGLILYFKDKYMTIRLNEQETKEFYKKTFGKDITLPADYPSPEFVHLEISNRCNLNCPYCYSGPKKKEELTTEQWKLIVSRLAAWGVHQLTFGGGEPLMKEGIIELARYVKEQGLNLTMTSNGILIPYVSKDSLSYFDQINISYHKANREPKKILEEALKHLVKRGIQRGVNYCLSKQYVEDLDAVADLCKKYDAELLLLTYKPVIGDQENQIPPKEVLKIGYALVSKKIKVAVDGATCNQCFGSKRFVDIDSKGNMFACSFIREPLGNVLTEKLEEIWKRRPKITCPYVTKEVSNE